MGVGIYVVGCVGVGMELTLWELNCGAGNPLGGLAQYVEPAHANWSLSKEKLC